MHYFFVDGDVWYCVGTVVYGFRCVQINVTESDLGYFCKFEALLVVFLRDILSGVSSLGLIYEFWTGHCGGGIFWIGNSSGQLWRCSIYNFYWLLIRTLICIVYSDSWDKIVCYSFYIIH